MKLMILKKTIIRVLGTALFLFTTFSILLLSIIRASFENISKADNLETSRTIPIEITIRYPNNDSEVFLYKIPHARITANHPFYIFKTIREHYWLTFSKGYYAKSKMALFLGDKKISESIILFKEGKVDLATSTAKDAFDKLEYAQFLFDKSGKIKSDELQLKIARAGITYQQILKSNYVKNDNLNNLIGKINAWNESQNHR